MDVFTPFLTVLLYTCWPSIRMWKMRTDGHHVYMIVFVNVHRMKTHQLHVLYIYSKLKKS